jgi:hypothetical protein
MTTERAIDGTSAPNAKPLQAAREIAATIGLHDEVEVI